MTGYSSAEVLGSNCRFLQGPETDPATLDELRRAIAERREFADDCKRLNGYLRHRDELGGGSEREHCVSVLGRSGA